MEFPGLAAPAPVARPPVSLSRSPLAINRRAPLLGEHTRELLEESGYGPEEISVLCEAGITRDATG